MKYALAVASVAALVAIVPMSCSRSPNPEAGPVSIAQEPVADYPQRIDAHLDASVERGFSGALLIAVDGNVEFAKGYGLANRESGTAISPETIFNIGSVTKQFTAAAIMKLVQDGKLSTDDRLSRFFPDVPDDKSDVTVHHLLTHTSGISSQAEGFRYDPATKEEFIESVFSQPLNRAPGGRYEYANAGYILLAAIIESVSGLDYEVYLRSVFFEPLGMRDTGYLLPRWDDAVLAHSYYYDLAQEDWADWGTTLERFANGRVSWNGIGKGDLHTTLVDLNLWLESLEERTILDESSVARLETAYVPEQPAAVSYYGYGWAIFRSPWDTKIVTHDGSNGLYFADVVRYIDERVDIVLLTNLSRDMGGFAMGLSRMIFDADAEPPPFTRSPYEVLVGYIDDGARPDAEALLDHYETVQGTGIGDRSILNRTGLSYLEKGNHPWAIVLLELNTRLFPGDGNLWDSLGEAHFLSGDVEAAARSFEESLRLAPADGCYWCDHARSRLDAATRAAR